MTTITEQVKWMKRREIVGFLVGVLDGQQFLIEAQQVQIDALRIEHRAEIDSLKSQVTRLQDASPLGAPPRADGSNIGRSKLFKA